MVSKVFKKLLVLTLLLSILFSGEYISISFNLKMDGLNLYYFGINEKDYPKGAIRGTSIIKDSNNNVYIGGFIHNGILPGKKVFVKKQDYKSSEYDGYIIKTDSKGNVLWSSYVPGEVNTLLLTKDGNLLIIGDSVNYQFSFNVSHNYYFRDPSDSYHLQYIYIICLDSSGNLLWSTIFASGPSNSATTAQVLDNGELLLLGVTSSMSFPFTNTNYLSPKYPRNFYFLSKFSPEGSFLEGSYLKNQTVDLITSSITRDGYCYAILGFLNENNRNQSLWQIVKFSSNFSIIWESQEMVLENQTGVIYHIHGITILNDSFLAVYGSITTPGHITPWFRLVSSVSYQTVKEYTINDKLYGHVNGVTLKGQHSLLLSISSYTDSFTSIDPTADKFSYYSYILLTNIDLNGTLITNTFYGPPAGITDEAAFIPFETNQFLVLAKSNYNLVVFSVNEKGISPQKINFTPDLRSYETTLKM